jgi:hypothetical protein
MSLNGMRKSRNLFDHLIGKFIWNEWTAEENIKLKREWRRKEKKRKKMKKNEMKRTEQNRTEKYIKLNNEMKWKEKKRIELNWIHENWLEWKLPWAVSILN